MTFALKYEGADLAIMKSLFGALAIEDITASVENEITGAYSRRIWFFYEWLTAHVLPIEDVITGNYVDALNEELQFGCAKTKVSRQRINNNLPGVKGFCPLIKKNREACSVYRGKLRRKSGKKI